MSVNNKVLFEAKDAGTAQTTDYTSANARTIIDKLTACNTTAGALTLSVNLVPLAGTAGATNLIVKTKSIAAGETYTFPELVGQYLMPGGFISSIASAAGITIRACGREIT
jgi:hypothetical protein